MRQTSDVWNHFVKLTKNKAKCLHCDKVLGYSSSSNLIRHLRNKHAHIKRGFKAKVKRLIDLVYQRRPLWDQTDPESQKNDEVDIFWQDVASQLNMPVSVAKRKWKSLKIIYKKEIKKMVLDPENYHSKWAYFNDLDFLSNQQEFINADEAEDDPELEECSMDDDSSVYITELEVDADESENQLTPYEKKPKFCTPESKKRKKKEVNDELECIQQERTEWVTPDYHEIYREDFDEDMNFFYSLLPHVKKLSTIEKLHLRNDFNTILLKYLHSNTRPGNHSLLDVSDASGKKHDIKQPMVLEVENITIA